MCCNSRKALSRLGVLWGLLALATLLVAFVSGTWLYTKEPVTLPNSDITTIISFRIGLWRACPSVKKINVSIHVPSPSCFLVKYSRWEEIRSTDLGFTTQLELAPVFITRMRSCTVLMGCALILLLAGSFLALLGHCNNDNKTLTACGVYILSALGLGTGLVIFASALSETVIEITQYHKQHISGFPYDYRYGWCFFTAGIAFIMTKIAAVFSLTGYLNRFPSMDEMVREMVPGAERKLREHQMLSNEHLVRLSGASCQQYDPICTSRFKYEPECGPLLHKTPPDVCSTNKSADFSDSCSKKQAATEQNFIASNPLAGQTIPITIKNRNSSISFCYPNFATNKYGTLPSTGTIVHQGFLGVSETEKSSTSYSSKSKTLQHQRPRKKCIKIETFQTPDSGFTDFTKKTNNLGYSGSAV